MLTEAGAAQVEESRQRWSNRVFRNRIARNALLMWLHDQGETPQGSVLLDRFLDDPGSAVEGHFLSTPDLDAAAAYLRDKGLIQGVATVSGRQGPVRARLTAEGIDCIENGGNVAEYLTPRESRVTYNFHGPVSGTNVAVGDNATQNATINGVDADGLRTVIQAVIEALPGLGLSDPDQEGAQAAANEVVAELSRREPDKSRLSTAMGKLGSVLTSSAKQALAAVLTGVIDYELARMGIPPAGLG
jgi:hypothetical protein